MLYVQLTTALFKAIIQMAENENKLPKPLKFAYFSFTSFSSLFDNNNENDGGSVSGNWKKIYIFRDFVDEVH